MINHDSELEVYSLDSTVKLFKTVVGKTGNIYYPGLYGPRKPLPERFMTAQYVELVSGKVKEEGIEKESKVLTEHKPSPGLIEEVSLHKNESKVDKFEIKTKSSFEPTVESININTATKAEIVALQGVGSKTADKVIELRELFPFSDYTDLNTRVQLTFGRDWKEFNLEF